MAKSKNKYSMALKHRLWKQFDGKCPYCGVEFSDDSFEPVLRNKFSIDHIVPQSKGGGNNHGNLVGCCFGCNASKGTKTIEEFRASITKKNAPFTQDQYIILNKHDVKLPEELLPKHHIFYFERTK